MILCFDTWSAQKTVVSLSKGTNQLFWDSRLCEPPYFWLYARLRHLCIISIAHALHDTAVVEDCPSLSLSRFKNTPEVFIRNPDLSRFMEDLVVYADRSIFGCGSSWLNRFFAWRNVTKGVFSEESSKIWISNISQNCSKRNLKLPELAWDVWGC